MVRGYLNAFEIAPGEDLGAHVAGAGEVRLDLRRLIHADPDPLGPGVRDEPVSWPLSPAAPVAEHPTVVGSSVLIEHCFAGDDEPLTLCSWIWPTHLRPVNVLAAFATERGTLALAIVDGHLGLDLGDERVLSSPHALHERQWHFVALALAPGDGTVKIAWGQRGRTGGPYELVRTLPHPLRPLRDGRLALGGSLDPERPAGLFDGKLHDPALLGDVPDAIGLMDIMNFGPGVARPGGKTRALWRFGSERSLADVVDVTHHGHDGRLINAPALGVTGPPPLDGEPVEPPHGPPFATVHLHRDDLEDAAWPTTHTLAVPADARSGFYCLSARGPAGVAEMPFVVTPRVNPPVLLVAPTYTWQAYANLGRDPERYPGLSHYALHADGSPVYVTTRLKAAPTLAPDAVMEVDSVDSFTGSEAGEGAPGAKHLLMADLYANYFLEHAGFDYGVITDAVLDRGGIDALAGAQVVILSAHPEYYTASMLDALGAFLDRGGNLVYLGGNGLYWVTSIDPERPHLMEVRRGEASQTWSAEPGEERHVFTPQRGGTWAARGRPPDALVSVGFAGFGWDKGVAFQRTPESYLDEFAWVFAGVERPSFGETGLNLGGAVAFEFDCHHLHLTPPGATVLARALPASGMFFRSFEAGAGRAPDALTRANVVIRTTPAGGIVFSLSSVAASGCLPVNDGDNDMARICTNVLRRMLA